jgi:2-polyprenyl-6-methoxyphenol hydroxylase-like FAD-dependent oxidoreductase
VPATEHVLNVERAAVPSDTISDDVIKPPGLAALRRGGLFDTMLATGCTPIGRAPDPHRRSARAAPAAGGRAPADDCAAPHRSRHILVEAAAEAGADLHEQTTVSAFLHEPGPVDGIQSRSRTGRRLRACAPVVIGADGRQSWIARQVAVPYNLYKPTISLAYFAWDCLLD